MARSFVATGKHRKTRSTNVYRNRAPPKEEPPKARSSGDGRRRGRLGQTADPGGLDRFLSGPAEGSRDRSADTRPLAELLMMMIIIIVVVIQPLLH